MCDAKFDCSKVCSTPTNQWEACREETQSDGYFKDHTCRDVQACHAVEKCSDANYTSKQNCEINGNTWLTYPMEAYKVNPDAKGKSSKTCCERIKCEEIKCGKGMEPNGEVYGYNEQMCCRWTKEECPWCYDEDQMCKS